MSLNEQSLKVGTLEWFYREANPQQETDKPPVLLLHGLPAHSFCWCDLMPKIAASGRRAIAPDWIGFGFSAKPDRREFPYTPQAFIEALSDFLDTLKIRQFSLIVQGFLGSVGLQYAQRYPNQIDRLVIFNTPLTTSARLPWAIRQWTLPLVGEMLAQDPLLVDRTLEGGSGFTISENNLAAYRQPFLKSSKAGRSLIATVKNLQLPQSMAELEAGWPNWKTQTQIVWGMADPWLSSEDAETLADAPNIELVKLLQAKHYPQEHWVKEISPDLITFLRRQAL